MTHLKYLIQQDSGVFPLICSLHAQCLPVGRHGDRSPHLQWRLMITSKLDQGWGQRTAVVGYRYCPASLPALSHNSNDDGGQVRLTFPRWYRVLSVMEPSGCWNECQCVREITDYLWLNATSVDVLREIKGQSRTHPNPQCVGNNRRTH